jgi:hypothetical protein
MSRLSSRLSARARAVLGYAGGCAMAAVGVAVQFGAGWGLIAGGVVCAASFFTLADIDDPRERR